MNSREYNALVKRYEQQIELELSTGIINYNKDGKIKKSILLSRDITDGHQRRLQAEGYTVLECAKKLADQYQRKVEHIDNITKARTFGEVALEWYNVEIKDSAMSQGNKNNYYTDLTKHILPKLQKFDITQLKKKDYQLFLNAFAGKGISMVKKIRMTLVRIINYAMENEYMPERRINLKLPETVAIKKRKVFSSKEIALMMKAEKEYPPAYVFIVMLATGIRPCELYHIKYDDIDFKKGILHIKKSKTENGIRVIPLPDYPLSLIKDDREKLLSKGIEPIYAFHQQSDPLKPHNPSTLNRCWLTTLNKMDIINGAKLYRNKITETSLPDREELSPYNLRHTYCTMLNNCGIGEYFKKRLMGHTLNDSITDSVYTHSTEAELIKAASPFINYIESLFKDNLN